MIGEMLGSILATAVSGYEGLVAMFGSPATLLAISVALVAIAIIEICIRKHTKPQEAV